MRLRFTPYLLVALCLMIGSTKDAYAQSALYNAANNYLKKRADAFMTITGYSLTPDVTTGSLSIRNKDGDNSDLQMISLGGGDRISANFPLYLEGTLAVNRYNPTFSDGIGNSSVTVPVHWNSVTGTGGIGWDFPITDELRFRPIANVMLGHLESDLSIASRVIENRKGVDLQFLNGGRMNSYGLGGSVMLDYENYKPNQEIDVELRYTNIPVQTFDSSTAVQGSADSQSLALWARSRIPTPITLLDRPLRAVFELAHTEFLGDLRGALGFNSLSSVGTGIELDRSASDPIFSRVRVVFRYQFGQNVHGTSIGLAASF
ncbi:autotransporter domain-containing protein [Polynucleobacter yangtzensis]|nr:autotransporter domain-containing protein [Polynucleobacter yangtzensis]